jgi:pyruvate dehydrogenase E2 component (dihydrolipoamide acetyltransferase)
MAEVVVMPQLGNTVESCLITTWHASIGDNVEANSVLCGIETDKSAMDVPAGVAGVLLARLADAGDEVPVKKPLAIVGLAGEDIGELLASLGVSAPPPSAPVAAAPTPEPEAAAPTPEPEAAAPAPAPEAAAPAPEPEAAATPTPTPTAPVAAPPAASAARSTGVPKAASPRARELAAVYDIAIDTLTGTGPRGRIIERDVMAAVSGTATLLSASSSSPTAAPTADVPDQAVSAPSAIAPAAPALTSVSPVAITPTSPVTPVAVVPASSTTPAALPAAQATPAPDPESEPTIEIPVLGRETPPATAVEQPEPAVQAVAPEPVPAAAPEPAPADTTAAEPPAGDKAHDPGPHWLTRGAQAAEAPEALEAVAEAAGQATGIGGRLTRADLGIAMPPVAPATSTAGAAVESIAPSTATPAVGPQTPAPNTSPTVPQVSPIDDSDFPGPVTTTPLRGIRKLVAGRMLASMANHAQLTFDSSAPATNLLNLRKRLKRSNPALGMAGVTLGDLVAYAAVQVARKYPAINATLVDGVLTTYSEIHLGLAVDTPRGLLVPTIRHASRMGLRQFAAQTKDLAHQARSGSINPDLLSGGTFTVTNLGAFGIEAFTPILNSPQTAILGVNTIVPRPLARSDGSYGVEQRIGFSLTVDHAVVDGADAARYLADLVTLVTDIDIAVLD